MNRRRGWTAIEAIVGLLCTAVLLTALYSLLGALNVVQTVTADMTASTRDARNALDTMADHLRTSQLCTASGGSLVTNASIGSGATNDVTYYSDSSGTTVRYFLSGTNLQRTAGGTTTTALTNVTSLSYTYYTSSTYNSTSLTATANSHAPTAAELPQLAAIGITASTTTDGRTVQYSSIVRLRNSPKRGNLKGN